MATGDGQLIDSIVDRAAITGDVDFIDKAIQDVIAAIASTKGAGIDILNAKNFKEYTDAVNSTAKAQQNAAKASDALNKALISEAKASEAAAKAKIAEAKAGDAVAKSKVTEAKTAQQLEAIKNREKKATDDAANEYLKLSRAYNEAALKAKNYFLVLGENHPVTVQAVKDANDIGNSLKKADAVVGQFQRNVGNYKSAFDGLGFSFTQVARELPSLAINFQTFALAISNNLPMVIDELRKTSSEIATLKAEGKEAPSLFEKLKSSIFSFNVGISIVIALFTVFNKQIVNFISGLFGSSNAAEKSAEAMKKYSDALEKGKQRIDAFIAAQEFLKRIGPINSKILFGDKVGAELDDLRSESIETATSLVNVRTELENIRLADLKAQQQRSDGVLIEGDYNKVIEANSKRRTELQTKEADLSSDQRVIYRQIALQRINDEKELTERSHEETEKRLKLLATIRAAQFEAARIDAERLATDSDAELEQETKSLSARLAALSNYAFAKGEVLRLNQQEEIAEAQDAANEQLRDDKVTADQRLLIRRNLALQIQLINQKFADAEIDLVNETEKKRNKIIAEERIPKAEQLTQEEIEVYDKFYSALEARIKRYNDEKTRLAEEQKKKDKYYADERKKLEEKLIEELKGLAFELFDAQFERQKNAIQEEIDLLEERKQKAIETENQTAQSAQDRAARISAVEATAAAERDALQRKARRVQEQQAKFDKAKAITDIIQNTAVAILGFLKNPGGPQGVALSILAGAIGAVQLAKVIATPIPKYKEGTDDHPGGLFIAGDGGKREVVEEPGKHPYLTSDKPRLYWGAPGTVVHSDANEYAKSLHTGIPVYQQQSSSTDISPVVDALTRQTTKIVKALNKPMVTIRPGRRWNEYMQHGGTFTKKL